MPRTGQTRKTWRSQPCLRGLFCSIADACQAPSRTRCGKSCLTALHSSGMCSGRGARPFAALARQKAAERKMEALAKDRAREDSRRPCSGSFESEDTCLAHARLQAQSVHCSSRILERTAQAFDHRSGEYVHAEGCPIVAIHRPRLSSQPERRVGRVGRP